MKKQIEKLTKQSAKGRFFDIFEPPFGTTVSPEATFRLQSIISIPEGAEMHLMVWDRETGDKIISLPPVPYTSLFTLPEVFRKCQEPSVVKGAYEHVDMETFELRDGKYMIRVRVEWPGFRDTTRKYEFNIRKGYQEPPFSDKRVWCQAAWKNMLLRPGSVVPCCHMKRRVRSVFNYDNPEFYEPRNSPAFVALRESLVNGNAQYCYPGCPYLRSEPWKPDITNLPSEETVRANAELMLQEYQQGRSVLKSEPMDLSVNLGKACNNGCIFCRVPATKRNVTLSDNVIRLIKKYAPTLTRIWFSGGEPLLYFRHIESFKQMGLFEHGPIVTIQTNGILIQDLLEPLRLLPNLWLSVAMNTPDRETYEKLHLRDNFDKIVYGLRSLVETRRDNPFTLELKMLVMRTTHRQIMDFARLAADIGVDSVVYRPLLIYARTPIHPDEKIQPNTPEYNEVNCAMSEAKQFLTERGIEFKWTGWDSTCDEYNLTV